MPSNPSDSQKDLDKIDTMLAALPEEKSQEQLDEIMAIIRANPMLLTERREPLPRSELVELLFEKNIPLDGWPAEIKKDDLKRDYPTLYDMFAKANPQLVGQLFNFTAELIDENKIKKSQIEDAVLFKKSASDQSLLLRLIKHGCDANTLETCLKYTKNQSVKELTKGDFPNYSGYLNAFSANNMAAIDFLLLHNLHPDLGLFVDHFYMYTNKDIPSPRMLNFLLTEINKLAEADPKSRQVWELSQRLWNVLGNNLIKINKNIDNNHLRLAAYEQILPLLDAVKITDAIKYETRNNNDESINKTINTIIDNLTAIKERTRPILENTAYASGSDMSYLLGKIYSNLGDMTNAQLCYQEAAIGNAYANITLATHYLTEDKQTRKAYAYLQEAMQLSQHSIIDLIELPNAIEIATYLLLMPTKNPSPKLSSTESKSSLETLSLHGNSKAAEEKSAMLLESKKFRSEIMANIVSPIIEYTKDKLDVSPRLTLDHFAKLAELFCLDVPKGLEVERYQLALICAIKVYYGTNPADSDPTFRLENINRIFNLILFEKIAANKQDYLDIDREISDKLKSGSIEDFCDICILLSEMNSNDNPKDAAMWMNMAIDLSNKQGNMSFVDNALRNFEEKNAEQASKLLDQVKTYESFTFPQSVRYIEALQRKYELDPSPQLLNKMIEVQSHADNLMQEYLKDPLKSDIPTKQFENSSKQFKILQEKIQPSQSTPSDNSETPTIRR